MNREVLREADNAVQRMLLQPPLPSKAIKVYPSPVQKASHAVVQFGIQGVAVEPSQVGDCPMPKQMRRLDAGLHPAGRRPLRSPQHGAARPWRWLDAELPDLPQD